MKAIIKNGKMLFVGKDAEARKVFRETDGEVYLFVKERRKRTPEVAKKESKPSTPKSGKKSGRKPKKELKDSTPKKDSK